MVKFSTTIAALAALYAPSAVVQSQWLEEWA